MGWEKLLMLKLKRKRKREAEVVFMEAQTNPDRLGINRQLHFYKYT